MVAIVGLSSCTSLVDEICNTGDCFYKENVDPTSIPSIIEGFILDMGRHGIHEADYPNTYSRARYMVKNMAFGHISDPNHVAESYTRCDQGGRFGINFTLVRQSYFNEINDGQRISLVYHELGHIVFGMEHSTDRNSIMYSTAERTPNATVHDLIAGIDSLFADYLAGNLVTHCDGNVPRKGNGEIVYKCNPGKFE